MKVQTRSSSRSVSSAEAATRAILDLTSKFTNRLEDGNGPGHKIISAGLAPRGVERGALEERRAHLLAALAPAADPDQQMLLARIVGGLLAAFPTFGSGEDQAKLAVGMIVRALDDVPVWAVQKAAANFLKGRQKVAWNSDRAPTPPQIRSEAMLAVLDVETELRRISQVLDAELVDNDTTQDQRDAAIARWKEIRAGIAGANVISERTDDDVNRERDAQQRANKLVRARERGDQRTLSEQLNAGKEPFEAYPREGVSA